jgi:hypothetical protein
MQFGRFEKDASLTVAELLHPEAHIDMSEHQTSLSVKVTVSTAAMLNVFCDHFGQSRYAFSGSILDDYTADLFASLPEELRVSLAEKADLQATELLDKMGITTHSEGVLGKFDQDTTWRYQNLAMSHKEGV